MEGAGTMKGVGRGWTESGSGGDRTAPTTSSIGVGPGPGEFTHRAHTARAPRRVFERLLQEMIRL